MLMFSIAAHKPFFKYLLMFVEKAEDLQGILQNPTRKKPNGVEAGARVASTHPWQRRDQTSVVAAACSKRLSSLGPSLEVHSPAKI